MTVRKIFSSGPTLSVGSDNSVSAASPFPRVLRPGRAPPRYSCPPRLYSARFAGLAFHYTVRSAFVKRPYGRKLHLNCTYGYILGETLFVAQRAFPPDPLRERRSGKGLLITMNRPSWKEAQGNGCCLCIKIRPFPFPEFYVTIPRTKERTVILCAADARAAKK